MNISHETKESLALATLILVLTLTGIGLATIIEWLVRIAKIIG